MPFNHGPRCLSMRPSTPGLRPRLLENNWLLLALFVSCSAGPEIGEVEGRVLLNEEPLAGVRILFLPDPLKQTLGPHSSSVTDDSGRYELQLHNDGGQAGAVVGWHRVTIEDSRAEDMRGSGWSPHIRVLPRYSAVSQTPFRFEVRTGRQTIDLQLKNEAD